MMGHGCSLECSTSGRSPPRPPVLSEGPACRGVPGAGWSAWLLAFRVERCVWLEGQSPRTPWVLGAERIYSPDSDCGFSGKGRLAGSRMSDYFKPSAQVGAGKGVSVHRSNGDPPSRSLQSWVPLGTQPPGHPVLELPGGTCRDR